MSYTPKIIGFTFCVNLLLTTIDTLFFPNDAKQCFGPITNIITSYCRRVIFLYFILVYSNADFKLVIISLYTGYLCYWLILFNGRSQVEI